MTFAKYTPEQMDDFGEEAGIELDQLSREMDITQIADWVVRWYLKAGYKRLGRKMLEYKTGKLEKDE